MEITDYLASFRLWLESHHYRTNTIRNYLSDINLYLSFTQGQDPFSPSLLETYLLQIFGQKNYPRRLATLRLFCQYAVDQNLVSHNPLKHLPSATSPQKISPTTDDFDKVIKIYQKYLYRHGKSYQTIRSYINDLRQYYSWLNK